MAIMRVTRHSVTLPAHALNCQDEQYNGQRQLTIGGSALIAISGVRTWMQRTAVAVGRRNGQKYKGRNS